MYMYTLVRKLFANNAVNVLVHAMRSTMTSTKMLKFLKNMPSHVYN